MNEIDNFSRLMEIVRILRSPEGCPWDREQTHESMSMSLVEESYEAKEAIDNHDVPNLCEELGDVMLLIALHSVMAEECGEFTISDVLEGISMKMIQRHPHVFTAADKKITSEEVLDNWEEIKKKEKSEKTVGEGMERVAKSLPALIRAAKLQEKARKAGLDLTGAEQALKAVREKLSAIENHAAESINGGMEAEFGELMFNTVALARFLGINAENSLTNASNAFINRFVTQEKPARSREENLSLANEGELEALWRLNDI